MSTNVLLVDDEETFVQTLAKRLTLRRLNVFTATDARTAFAKLDDHRIDVVVLDVKMPDIDGIEATRTIKADHPLVEVILLTGHANLEASLEGMRMGAFDYLLKPVKIDDLVYKIEDAHRKKDLQEEKIRRLSEHSESAGREA